MKNIRVRLRAQSLLMAMILFQQHLICSASRQELKNNARSCKKLRILLHQLYLAKKTKVERKFIKEEKCRNATAFQVFLTQRNFLYAEYLTARFSWWSNIIKVIYKILKNPQKKFVFRAIVIIGGLVMYS